MSAGHGHVRPNHRHPAELKKLMQEGGAPELMQRFERLDVDHDITDLAGYSVDGTVRYLDRDFLQALLDPEHAKEIGVTIDTGLKPDQVVEAVLEHEAIEKSLLDADNDVNSYQAAHEFATVGEHEKVRSFGGAPIKYERGLAAIIAYCGKKTPEEVPADLACAPYLDRPNKNDKRALKVFTALGVEDASKTAKLSVDYGRSTSGDQCGGCAHWQGEPGAPLSPCTVVDGLVRQDRWCKKWSPILGDHNAAPIPTS